MTKVYWLTELIYLQYNSRTMKLNAADIERLITENVKPRVVHSADDALDPNERRRLELIRNYSENSNQSRAKEGEVLPRAPKSLKVVADTPNDFGLTCTDTTTTEGQSVEVAPSELPELPQALVGIDLNSITSRADLIAQLSTNLPLNEMGFPRYIYRSDLLDLAIFQGANSKFSTIPAQIARYAQMQDYLDTATVYLNQNEGFPALPSGQPFWARLDHETPEQFDAFLQYCELPGIRQVNLVKSRALDEVLGLFHEFYWTPRARCYDLHHTIHHAKLREGRILRAENDHWDASQALFRKLTDMMGTIEWDVLAGEPEKFVAVMEKVQKMMRTSIGLSPQGGGSNEVKTESVEATLKKLQNPENADLRLNGDDAVDVRSILRNPDALASAQELIVRMTKTITKRRDEAE